MKRVVEGSKPLLCDGECGTLWREHQPLTWSGVGLAQGQDCKGTTAQRWLRAMGTWRQLQGG